MKLSKLFMTSLLSLLTVGVFAEKVTVNTTEFKPGGTVDMSVSLENTSNVSGYTMRLYLPEGISVVTGDNVYKLSERHGQEYSITQKKASDGSSLLVVSSSKSGDVIKEHSGVLFTTKLSIASTVTVSKQAKLMSIAISDSEGKETALDNVVFDIIRVPEVTIAATSYSRQYGESNPTFEYDVKGGKLDGTPSVACEATVTSPVGEYDIVVTQGSVTTQNVTYVNGKLTITRAPLTITAKSYSIEKGEALPTFEADYTGFKNGETVDVLTKKPVLTTTATSNSEPGIYDIIVSDAEADNYEITYVSGKIEVKKPAYIPGDANGDGRISIADASLIVDYILSGGTITISAGADMNGDGKISIADASTIVDYILSGH